eukprot:1159832-Pelagomonas_calceolata.AAC.14
MACVPALPSPTTAVASSWALFCCIVWSERPPQQGCRFLGKSQVHAAHGQFPPPAALVRAN